MTSPLSRLLRWTATSCVLAACGASAPPLPAPPRLAALAAIEVAEAHGAHDTRASLIQLALANEELQLADEQADAGNMREAALLLDKAEADAERATDLMIALHRADAGVE